MGSSISTSSVARASPASVPRATPPDSSILPCFPKACPSAPSRPPLGVTPLASSTPLLSECDPDWVSIQLTAPSKLLCLRRAMAAASSG